MSILDCMEVLNNTIVLKLQPQTTLTDEQLNAAELARLLNETKKLICHACQVQNARNIDQLLAQESSLEQREMYTKYSDGSDFEDDKKKIGSNLETLCNANIIATQDDIIKLISKDIKEQHRLRARRKQELEKLQNTKRRLVTKGKYYEEQANYYERYITDCLAKQTAVKEGKRRKSIRTSFRSKSTSSSVKYSAEDLRKKGVLIEIINEDISSYKRLQVSFQFSNISKNIFKLFSKFSTTLILLVHYYSNRKYWPMERYSHLPGGQCVDDPFGPPRLVTKAV